MGIWQNAWDYVAALRRLSNAAADRPHPRAPRRAAWRYAMLIDICVCSAFFLLLVIMYMWKAALMKLDNSRIIFQNVISYTQWISPSRHLLGRLFELVVNAYQKRQSTFPYRWSRTHKDLQCHIGLNSSSGNQLKVQLNTAYKNCITRIFKGMPRVACTHTTSRVLSIFVRCPS